MVFIWQSSSTHGVYNFYGNWSLFGGVLFYSILFDMRIISFVVWIVYSFSISFLSYVVSSELISNRLIDEPISKVFSLIESIVTFFASGFMWLAYLLIVKRLVSMSNDEIKFKLLFEKWTPILLIPTLGYLSATANVVFREKAFDSIDTLMSVVFTNTIIFQMVLLVVPAYGIVILKKYYEIGYNFAVPYCIGPVVVFYLFNLIVG